MFKADHTMPQDNQLVRQKSNGTILRLERSSIHDGEGLRTVIFLKGCPLRCAWCSTPEGWLPGITETNAVSYGYTVTADELLDEIIKDEIFFFHSGGGITFSGGEPLCQAEFVTDVAAGTRKLGISTAMESSLCHSWPVVEKVLPHLDILYADLKHIDPEQHKFYTGQDNQKILENIRRVSDSGLPLQLIIRMVLIPGINDDEAILRQTGDFLQSLPNLTEVELLPYHRLGVGTYGKLGLQYRLPEAKVPSKSELQRGKAILSQYVSNVK